MRFNVLTAEFLPDWVKVIPTGPSTSLRPDPMPSPPADVTAVRTVGRRHRRSYWSTRHTASTATASSPSPPKGAARKRATATTR